MDDDDRLRLAFARAFEAGLPTDDCPRAEALFDAACGELPAEARGAVIDHLATCPVCAEAWRIARAMRDGAGGSGP